MISASLKIRRGLGKDKRRKTKTIGRITGVQDVFDVAEPFTLDGGKSKKNDRSEETSAAHV